MFSGIVEELGQILEIEKNATGRRLRIAAKLVLTDTKIGDSIAVNGVCLTVVDKSDSWWEADAVEETMDRTALGGLQVGDTVNLERALRLDQRLGGHLVQGHVDGCGKVVSREPQADGSTRVSITAGDEILRYIVEKGSITIDGISMTVAALDEEQFTVAMIPHTAEVTTLGQAPVGRRVNLEVDVIAKYVERLAMPWKQSKEVSLT